MSVTAVMIMPVFAYAKNANVSSTETKLNSFKDFEVTTDLEMRGSSFSEGLEESQTVQLFVSPRAEVRVHEYFKLKAGVTVNLRSSRIQARFQNASSETFSLNELVVEFSPENYFELEVGAIDQSHLENRQLISPRAFPGVKLSSSFIKTDQVSAKAKLQYAIPTSSSLETDRSEAEELPILKTAGLEFEWEPISWIETSANINYFTFSDLPSVVAHRSDRLGNEVTGDEPTESFFAYGFRGISQSYKLKLKYTDRITNHLYIKTVENMDAPSDRSRAQHISLGLEVKFKTFSILPSLTSFYSESNSSPAVYNDAQLGHNNREGFVYGAKMSFPKQGFSIAANYVKADLIEAQSSQRDLKYLEVLLEVLNVKF